MRGLSVVAASGGHPSSRCAGLSLSRPLLLRSTGSRRAGSAAVAHGLCCSAACGIFPDQGSNPCPLHWQADSQWLHHQGSPGREIFERWWWPRGFMKPAISGLNKNSLFPFWVLFQKRAYHTCDFRATEKEFPTSHILSLGTSSAQLPEVSP